MAEQAHIPHKAKAPLWRRLLIAGLAVVGVLVVAGAGLALWLGTDSGRAWLAHTLSTRLDGDGLDVDVAGIDGWPLGRFSVRGLTVADADGIWLEAGQLDMAWRPMGLLSGTLSVASLESQNLHIVRPPEASGEKQPSEGGGLPVAIRLDAASLAIAYGDAAEHYSLKGRDIRVDGARITGNLVLVSESGGDKLQADIGWQGNTGALNADVSLKASKDGLIVGLAGLQELAPIDASLKGDGPLDKWQGEFDLRAGTVLEGTGMARGTGDGIEIKSNLSQKLALEPWLAGLVGDRPTLDIWIGLGADGPTPVRLIKDGAGAYLQLSGAVGQGGTVENGSIAALIGPYDAGSAIGGLTLANARLEGQFSLAWPVVKLEYKVAADAASAYGVATETLDTEGDIEMDRWHIGGDIASLSAARASMDVAGTPQDTDIQAMTGSWDVRRADGAWRIDNIAVRSGLATVTRLVAAGAPSGDLGDLTLEATVPGGSIARFAPGVLSGGSADVRLGASARDDSDALDIDYAVTGQGFVWADETLAGLLGADAGVSGRLVWRPGQSLDNIVVRLAGQHMSGAAGGRLDIAAGTIKGDFSVDINEDAPVLADTPVALPTGLQVAGHAEGALTAPGLRLHTSLGSVSGYGIEFGETSAVLQLAPSDAATGGWRGDIVVGSSTSAGPVSLTSDIKLADGGAVIGPLTFKSPVLRGDGQAIRDKDGGLDLVMSVTMLAPEETSFTIEGAASGLVSIKGRDGAYQGQLDVLADHVAISLPGQFPFALQSLKGKVDFSLGAETLGYRAALSLEKFRYGAQVVNTLSLSGDSRSADGFQLKAEGYMGNSFTLDARAKPTRRSADVSLDLMYGDVTLTSQQPIAIDWTTGLAVRAPALAIGDGTARLGIILKGQDMDVALTMDHVPLVAVNAARAGVFRDGHADLELSFVRDGDTDSGLLKATMQDVRFFTDSLVADDGVYSMSMLSELKDGLVTLKSGADLAGTPVGEVMGQMPVERATPGLFAIRAGAPIDLVLNWHGDVAPLWLLARRPDHMLEGRLVGKLSLTGDLDHPVFDGSLELEQGRYEYETLGLVAQDLRLSVKGDNRAVALESLSATDGNGGTLSGSGEFELSSKLSFPGALTVGFKDFRMARLDSLSGTASADLRYERASEADAVSGSIRTGTINFTLPKELPQSVVDIDVIEVGLDESEPEAPMALSLARRKVTTLDIGVRVPGQLFVRGRGLESEWEGALKIAGSTENPAITGVMDLKSGTFLLGGKRFTIKDGSLTFRGGRQIDPEISLTADYATAGLAAELKISGPVSAPKFSLTSTPALAEDEILARILFGRSVADLSPLQIAELAVALNGLRGSNALDVVGKLRRQLGLDTLTVSSGDGDERGALLTGGKYIRDNVYLEVETSTAASEAAARLRVNLTKNLLAESEVGPRLGSSLKVKWFWEY
ncbi:MAG: hypothetical protein EP335_08825 [Alphaproteobacteria bacterium]|nr:MAG: hypothetical protein EP335_08825 [Alphaproteobacteria bacterium]